MNLGEMPILDREILDINDEYLIKEKFLRNNYMEYKNGLILEW